MKRNKTYRKVVEKIKKNPALTIVVALIIIAVAFTYLPQLTAQFNGRPSEAANLISPGTPPSQGGIPIHPDWNFNSVIQLTGQPGFPPDGSYDYFAGSEWTSSIYGDWLVFRWDPTIGGGNPYAQQYMLYNIKTKEIRQITNGNNKKDDNPKIWGNYVVWVGNDLNLYLYNIPNNTTSKLTTDSKIYCNYEHCIDISENRIVFVKKLDDEYPVYLIDLDVGFDAIELPTTKYIKTNPVISRSIIAWEDYRNMVQPLVTFSEIYAYDLDNEIEFSVSTELSQKQNLQISNNNVLWIENPVTFPFPSHPYLYLYNINNGQGGKITLTKANHIGFPSISNGYVTYSGGIGSLNNAKIYMYEISTKQETLISNSIANSFVLIFMDKTPVIIWGSITGGSHNLFMAQGTLFSNLIK